MKSFENLTQELRNVPNEYKSIPFWSWNNTLEKDELLRQIDEMHGAGIGGFIMHARTGLKDEYLGEKWFDIIKACLEKAKDLKMDAWVYDENGWPSGFVGGKLLENVDFRAQYLEYSTKDSFDPIAFASFVEEEDGSYKRVVNNVKGVNLYHNVYLKTSPSNTDILNPEVVDAFIKETHEEYYKRFKDSFGKELVGFFTDEPQYYRWGTPYSKYALYEFQKRGKDIRDGLIYLFKHNKHGYAFKTEYFNTLNYLYVKNFYKKIFDWCNDHNCMLTGHSVEEGGLLPQMWGGADVSTSYEYEHIPAIDHLGGQVVSVQAYRQIGSVASQLGIKHILSEMYACSSHDATPRILRHICEAQYFNGVNKTCQHLFPYSITAQGRIDHPPVFSRHNNWFKEFKGYNEHFNKLGYLVANTINVHDIAVLHPIRSIYPEYVRFDDSNDLQKYEDWFVHEFLVDLNNHGIKYDFIDETYLEKYGEVKDNSLILNNCSYKVIVIPKMISISKSTYEKLKEYKGSLLILGDINYIDGIKEEVDLKSNMTIDDLYNTPSLKFEVISGLAQVTERRGELGDFIFIKNLSNTGNSKVFLDGISKEYKGFDIDTLSLYDISDEFDIDKYGSYILYKTDDLNKPINHKNEINITSSFKVNGISDNYLVLDYVRAKYDSNDYTEKTYIQKVFDDLLYKDYKGDLFLKYEFTLKDLMPIKLLVEDSKYKYIKVNGEEIVLNNSDYDILYREADITKYLKLGLNEIEYEIYYYEHDLVHFALFDPECTESVVNCLYYDTTLENFYLKGDFKVDPVTHEISKRDDYPSINSSIYKEGYPFFNGEVIYEGNFIYDGYGKVELGLDGKWLVADVFINGNEIEYVLDTHKDITKYLNNGNNDIKIALKSSLRNLYGPHHSVYGNPDSVSPIIFTCRSLFIKENGKPNLYVEKYNYADFGLDNIIIKKEEI